MSKSHVAYNSPTFNAISSPPYEARLLNKAMALPSSIKSLLSSCFSCNFIINRESALSPDNRARKYRQVIVQISKIKSIRYSLRKSASIRRQLARMSSLISGCLPFSTFFRSSAFRCATFAFTCINRHYFNN